MTDPSEEVEALRAQLREKEAELEALKARYSELEARVEAEERIFANAADMLQRYDREGVCLYTSPACRAILGYEPEELVGRSSFSLYHPDDVEPMKAVLAAILEGKPSGQVTGRMLSKGGEYVYIEFSPVIIAAEDGSLREIVTTGRDVSERKRTEEALRSAKARFRALIESLQVGVVVQGPNSEVLMVNPVALELLGLTEEQMLGRTSFDPRWQTIHEDGSPFTSDVYPVPVAIATKKPVRNVVMGVFRPSKDDMVWILASAQPQLDDAGEVVQVVCTFADITARKMAEDVVREQALMLEELSTPLIPFDNRMVVMPLVGTVDARRAEKVLETLLAGISERGAEVAILDITGVGVVDTQVAETLIRSAQAARLLGAQVVLSGIRGSVAKTLVDLGVDLTQVVTHSTLQGGIAWALSHRGGRRK